MNENIDEYTSDLSKTQTKYIEIPTIDGVPPSCGTCHMFLVALSIASIIPRETKVRLSYLSRVIAMSNYRCCFICNNIWFLWMSAYFALCITNVVIWNKFRWSRKKVKILWILVHFLIYSHPSYLEKYVVPTNMRNSSEIVYDELEFILNPHFYLFYWIFNYIHV